mmetsp:Transcript_58/g.109  ORF Transcript_58/g.109 Transcript_58/m.109 type:complete len:84 (-) Transcript_58:211-462(-)
MVMSCISFRMTRCRSLIPAISRWLVGSSNKRTSGTYNSALVSCTRIFHPPDSSEYFRLRNEALILSFLIACMISVSPICSVSS